MKGVTSALRAPVQSAKIGEVVLSDGRFAAIYKLTLGDFMDCAHKDVNMQLALRLQKTITLDEQRPSLEDILALPMEDVATIINAK